MPAREMFFTFDEDVKINKKTLVKRWLRKPIIKENVISFYETELSNVNKWSCKDFEDWADKNFEDYLSRMEIRDKNEKTKQLIQDGCK